MTEDMRIIETVARNVREARKEVGLSQEELAIEAGVDRTYISQVERGKRNITVVVLDRLARAMRTTAAALVSDSARSFANNMRDSRLGPIAIHASYWLTCWAIVRHYQYSWGGWAEIVRYL